MFRFFDMEDKGVIDFKRFMSVLDKLGCNFLQK
jgi:Ca2+-binding EF-hand superfamily protein